MNGITNTKRKLRQNTGAVLLAVAIGALFWPNKGNITHTFVCEESRLEEITSFHGGAISSMRVEDMDQDDVPDRYLTCNDGCVYAELSAQVRKFPKAKGWFYWINPMWEEKDLNPFMNYQASSTNSLDDRMKKALKHQYTYGCSFANTPDDKNY